MLWCLVFLVFLVAWYFTPAYVDSRIGNALEASPGVYGDTFGVVTSLFSVVTTMLVLAGLILQRDEILILRADKQAEEMRKRTAAWPRFELYLDPGGGHSVWNLTNLGGLAVDCEFRAKYLGGSRCLEISGYSEGTKRLLPRHFATGSCRQLLVTGLKIGQPCWQLEVYFTTLEGDEGRVEFLYQIKSDGSVWLEDRRNYYPWTVKKKSLHSLGN